MKHQKPLSRITSVVKARLLHRQNLADAERLRKERAAKEER
jgi:hypothetical protein